MMTIQQLVKNYFKKTEEQRLEIQSRVLADIIEIMEGEQISIDVIMKQLDILVKRAENREEYEIAEVFTKMMENIKLFIPTE